MFSMTDVRPKADATWVYSKVFIPALQVGISLLTMDELLHGVRLACQNGRKLLIDNVNMDILWHARQDAAYRQVLNDRANIILVDGVPVCWLAKMAGVEVPQRLALTDVVPMMLRLCARESYRVFVLGSNEITLAQAKGKLAASNSLPRSIHHWSQPRHLLDDPQINDAVLKQIQEARPQVIFVALGSPWQTMWIDRNWDRLPDCVIVPVGGAFDYIAGTVGRAPVWMQHAGLEWVYRLLFDRQRRERSLFERYIVQDFPFALRLACHIGLKRQSVQTLEASH